MLSLYRLRRCMSFTRFTFKVISLSFKTDVSLLKATLRKSVYNLPGYAFVPFWQNRQLQKL